jgi:hypothetical protein
MIQSRLYRSYQLSVVHSGRQQPTDEKVIPQARGWIRFFETLNTGPWLGSIVWTIAFLLPFPIAFFVLHPPAGSAFSWMLPYVGSFGIMVLMLRVHRYKIKWKGYQDKHLGTWLASLCWLYPATGYAPWAINRLAGILFSSFSPGNSYYLLASTIYLLFLLSASLIASQLSLLGDALVEKQRTIRTAQIALANAEAGKYFLRNMLDLLTEQRRNGINHLQLLHRLQSMTQDLLSYSPEQFIDLNTELEFIHIYAYLQDRCASGATHIEEDIPSFAGSARIAPFLAMALLEEAFSKAGQGDNKTDIAVSVDTQDGCFSFHVIHSSAEPCFASGHKGPGLLSVAQRLELIYPGRHELEIIEQGNTYSAKMCIPLQFQPGSYGNQSNCN